MTTVAHTVTNGGRGMKRGGHPKSRGGMAWGGGVLPPRRPSEQCCTQGHKWGEGAGMGCEGGGAPRRK